MYDTRRKLLITVLVAVLIVIAYFVSTSLHWVGKPIPILETPNDGPRSALLGSTLATYNNPGTIAPEYFGLHIQKIVPNWAGIVTPWPALQFGSWRFWDAGVAWPNLEPTKGNWKFQTLDQYVATAQSHGVKDFLLTLAMSPQWASARPNESSPYQPGWAAEPADIQDWRTYVRTVAQRYKGVITHYEIWNEPNGVFFTGTVDTMVSLACAAYQEIKAVDPTAIVVAPSGVSVGPAPLQWVDDFLRLGGGNCMDVFGYHFYVYSSSPENIVGSIDKIGALMLKYGVGNKPLWNTETGWYIANATAPNATSYLISDQTASAYILRALTLAAWKGVSRFYLYAWDDEIMGLIEPDTKKIKLSGYALVVAQDWLKGTTVSNCSQQSSIWVCALASPSGSVHHIVWSTNGTQSAQVPASWNADRVKTMSGQTISLPSDGIVQVSSQPILVTDGQP